VPSVHVLVRTLVFSIVLLMLLLKTEGDPASAIMFGFMSYMFVYALYLVRLLEQPFAKGHGSVDVPTRRARGQDARCARGRQGGGRSAGKHGPH
jgi:hypothetical protein